MKMVRTLFAEGMFQRHTPNHARRQKGTAIVEFAIAAPVMIYLLFASLQFAWLLNRYIAIENAVALGGRYFAGGAGDTTVNTRTVLIIKSATPSNLLSQLSAFTTSVKTADATSPTACTDPDCGDALLNAPGGEASVAVTYTVTPPWNIRLWGLHTLWPTTKVFSITQRIPEPS
jgi:Flp pilus assembly protein TadG